MRGDIDLREIPWSRLRSPRWRIGIGIAVLLAVGAWFGWRSITDPPRPWLVRWKLDRYLKKQAHAGDFKVDFPFPSKSEMVAPSGKESPAAPALGSRTGKDFETLRTEYFALKNAALQRERGREATVGATPAAATNVPAGEKVSQQTDEPMEPVIDDLWEFQRRWIADSAGLAGGDSLGKARADFTRQIEQRLATAGSYEAMYLGVGQELFVARRLLESANPSHRRAGVSIASTAARHALDHAVNGAVAARIAEGYLLPNLDLATDTSPRSPFNHQTYLRQCADLFRRNNEFQNVARTYALYLEHAKDPMRADWARSQMAMAYEEAAEPEKAIAALRQIRDTNTYSRLLRRIPRLQEESGLRP
jgi:hypothetical protein